MQAGSATFYVQVKDFDYFSRDDLVDIINVPISNLIPGESTGRMIRTTGRYGNGKITLSFQLECWNYFYGRNCARYCRPTDDSGGHFDCGPNGEIVCLSDWQDPANHCLTRKFASQSSLPSMIHIYTDSYM
jgi:hypothetical protein